MKGKHCDSYDTQDKRESDREGKRTDKWMRNKQSLEREKDERKEQVYAQNANIL